MQGKNGKWKWKKNKPKACLQLIFLVWFPSQNDDCDDYQKVNSSWNFYFVFCTLSSLSLIYSLAHLGYGDIENKKQKPDNFQKFCLAPWLFHIFFLFFFLFHLALIKILPLAITFASFDIRFCQYFFSSVSVSVVIPYPFHYLFYDDFFFHFFLCFASKFLFGVMNKKTTTEMTIM